MKLKKSISAVIALSCVMSGAALPVRAEDGASAVALSCDAYYGIYEAGETISYTLSGAADVTVTDYFGNVTNLGSFSDGATITPSVTKPGAYTITATSGDTSSSQRFAVMPKEADRRDSTDTPIAFASMATHTSGKRDHISGYMKTIKLAGVNYAREFIPANGTIKSVGNYDWTASGTNYHKLCDLMDAYAENDIGVMLMYQNMVKNSAEMPEDLYLVYDYTKAICQKFAGKMDAIEILNETEGYGSENTEGPEQYAALLKAAAIGAKDSGTGVKVVMTSFTGGKKEYAENISRNMTDDYYDVYNGHYYDDYESDKNIAVYPSDPGKYNANMAEFGVSNKPLWMTEFGLRIPYETGKVDLTAEQQKQQARTAPVSFVQSLASGTDRIFWFLHGYINENNKCYGDFGSDNKPYPVYSAISAFIDALGNGKYYGAISGLGDNVKAHTFKDGDETMLAIWAETEENVNVSVPQGAVIYDIMGNAEEFSGGTVTAGPDIQYIRAKGDITVNSVSAAYTKLPTVVDRTSDIQESDRIVIIPDFPENTRAVAKDAYQLYDTNEIGVTVFNFTDSEKSGNVTISSPGGWAADAAQKSVTVPSMGSKRVTFTVTKTDSVINQVKSSLIFGGTFGGEKITDSVAFVKSHDFIAGTAAKFTSQKWAHYSSGAGEKFTDLGEQSDGSRAIKFDFTNAKVSGKKNSAVTISSRYGSTIDLSGNEGFAFSVKADRVVGDLGMRIWITDSDGDSFYTHENLNYDTIQSMKTIYVADTYRQAVFANSELAWTTQKGDGILDLSKIKYISVGFTMYETINGNAITSADQIDTDCFTLYIKDICAIPNVKFTSDDTKTITPTVEYVDNKLITTMTDTARYVRHTINGVPYEADVMGNVAELPILLKGGTYNIITTAYNASNKPYSQAQQITVTRDGEYFVEYEADGADNVPQTQIKRRDVTLTLSETIPEKKNAIFIGWATEKDGEVVYRAGGEYTANADIKLYPVWFSWDGEKSDVIYKNAALLSSSAKIAAVKGNEKDLAGKTATLLVYRVTEENNGEAEDIADSDIVHIGEVKIDTDGNYAFSFEVTESGGYKYVLRTDSVVKNGKFTDAAINYKWLDAAANLTVKGKTARIWVKVKNHAKGPVSYSAILASEDAEGMNLVFWNDVTAPSGVSDYAIVQSVSEDYQTLKLMVWSDDYKLHPITKSAEVTAE